MKLWCWYIAGAVLTLAYKLGRYLYQGRKAGRPYKDIVCEWFFEPSSSNVVSWLTSGAVVWSFGVLLIQNVEFSGTEFLSKIPDVPAFAFLFGSIMELAAPAAAKWILGKLPGGTA